jgi:hypothetical protein
MTDMGRTIQRTGAALGVVLAAALALAAPVAAESLPAVVGTIEPVPVAGEPPPRWSPDTGIAVYGSGAATEFYLTERNATHRYIGRSLPTAVPSPARAVLGPSGGGFDRDYAGIAGVIHRPGGGPDDRLGYYHAERQCQEPDGEVHTLAAVGLAASDDGGRTWRRLGRLISSEVATDECDGFTGVGQPSVVIASDGGRAYVWVFYTDWTPDRANSIGVARAPLARAARPAAYRKYAGPGRWTPALGGDGAAVISRPTVDDHWATTPSVSWNTVARRFVAVWETDGGFYLSRSADLLHWSDWRRLLRFPAEKPPRTGEPWWSYATLLGVEARAGETGRSNWLYFGAGIAGGAPHTLVRVWTPVGLPPLPGSVALPPGGTFRPSPRRAPFAWVCSGDLAVKVGDGAFVPLYDEDADTGLVLGLESGSEITTVKAPWGGSCGPAYPRDLKAAVAATRAEVLANGCGGGGCRSVETVLYDPLGRR